MKRLKTGTPRWGCHERMNAAMPNDDKVYEAYHGERGVQVQKATEERIAWILSAAKSGGAVLDVGCSQGIISLLLGKNYSHVDGLDIQEESIAFAKELQAKEYPETQKNVRFFCADFLRYRPDFSYDCIVMTEVLEHLNDPAEFLCHAKEVLKEDGRIILSVPFSLNKHPDHKKTYYISDFYDLVSPFFYIEKIVFIGHWIGIVAQKSGRANPAIGDLAEAFLREEESQFLKVDTALQERNEALREATQAANEKAKQSEKNYATCKEWFEQRNEELQRQKAYKETLAQQLEDVREKLKAYQQNYETCKEWLANRTKEYEDCKRRLAEQAKESEAYKRRLEKREEQLDRLKNAKLDEQLMRCIQEQDQSIALLIAAKKEIQRLQAQNAYLKTENENYARKFAKITSTWYGNFALNCYHKLQKSKWRAMAFVRKIKKKLRGEKA